MLTTPKQLCRGALRLLGAVRQGETADPDDISDAYTALQEMMDQWRTDRLTIVIVEQATFTLTAGQQKYTIGDGGDFDRQRPLWLEQASVLYQGNAAQLLEYPLVKYDLGQWQENIALKAIQSTIPRFFYYDKASPLGGIYYYPVPMQTVQTKLYCPTALTEFTDLEQVVNMPPGYHGAIRFNLAVALGPEYDNGVPEVVIAKANEYLGNIRMVNDEPMMTRVDQALVSNGGAFNWYTGDFQ